jgi:hypothetical protein
MILLNPENYKFISFRKSNTKNKKYDAILKNKITMKTKIISFGSLDYQHYEDKALGIYSHLNHYDKQRRKLYKCRHNKDLKNKYSSGYFSNKYLW